MKHLFAVAVFTIIAGSCFSLAAAYKNFTDVAADHTYDISDSDVLGHRIGPSGELELVRPIQHITK